MRYAVNAKEMKQIDDYAIRQIGIPSMVLMERAALKVAEHTMKHAGMEDKIGVICGTGNNGGDGIAVARILYIRGYQVEIVLIGDKDKFSTEAGEQFQIAEKLGVPIRTNSSMSEYNVIIDAIFGIGLHKDIRGIQEEAVRAMNASKAFVVAVDIPSGVNADNGKVMNVAVKADLTVTFGEQKLGLLLYPGAEYAGEVHVEDIGFPDSYRQQMKPAYDYYEPEDLRLLPARHAFSNKGSYGKVLIIAGSEFMTGAALLSAAAAYRMGCGLVKVLTSDNGIEVIRQRLPEALYASYETDDREAVVKKSVEWADAIVIGPGLSTGNVAEELLRLVIKYTNVPTVYDADALNLLAMMFDKAGITGREERLNKLSSMLPDTSILTPHVKEMAVLLGCSVPEIQGEYIDIPEQCTYNNELVYVLKDARSLVARNKERYINVSGNHGMATGGSGDVLTGVIAGLLASKTDVYLSASLGVYIHGLAGDIAAKNVGYHSMLASDIVMALTEVMRENEGRSI